MDEVEIMRTLEDVDSNNSEIEDYAILKRMTMCYL